MISHALPVPNFITVTKLFLLSLEYQKLLLLFLLASLVEYGVSGKEAHERWRHQSMSLLGIREGLLTTNASRAFFMNFPAFTAVEVTLSFSQQMCGSCHFDRALNDKFSVWCLFWFFQATRKSDLHDTKH